MSEPDIDLDEDFEDRVIELSIPAKPEFVGLARLVVSSLAQNRRDLEEDRLDDLKLAVSEACTNAVEAHHQAGRSDPVIVRCFERDQYIEVWVQDRGQGFDEAELPEHPPVTDPQRLNFERGLGIPLIRTLVDRVQFASTGDGTLVRMEIDCAPALGLGSP